jgi:hypothetical protein
LAELRFWSITKNASIPAKQAALLRFLQSFHGSVEKGRFSAFFDRGALLPKWTALGVKTKFDATCKMVRSDWPQILGGSPGQSPGGRNGSPFMQSGGGSPRQSVRAVRQFGDGGVWFRV